MIRHRFLVLVALVFSGCAGVQGLRGDGSFGYRQDLGEVQYPLITEASGLAASRINKDVLWVHNDSGDESRVYAMNIRGEHLGVYYIADCPARDWEDMAVGPGPVPGQNYLYIGDIGDNLVRNAEVRVCRVSEPLLRDGVQVSNRLRAEVFTLRYPDGARDAETLMVDPRSGDLFIVSKEEGRARIYRAAYPQATDESILLERVAELALSTLVAGDISPDGDEILLKSYHQIFYWRRTAEQTVAQALLQTALAVSYIREPQGEALAWQAQGRGYFTVSEELAGLPAYLYFYPRR